MQHIIQNHMVPWPGGDSSGYAFNGENPSNTAAYFPLVMAYNALTLNQGFLMRPVTGNTPQVSFTYTNSQNRADSSSGIVYDAAGNVLVDSLGQHYTYDAEERITSMSSSTESATYEYDPEGNLVFEAGTSGTREFLRNSSGQPVQISRDGAYPTYPVYVDGEFIGSWYNSVFNWAGKNQVGTKNYVSWGVGDANSTAIPELIGTYTGDNLSSIGDDPLHFTGKERDAESNLDYFGARHYSSTMGRFITPDPSGLTYANPGDPQSFNLYSYVANHPLTEVDLNGLSWYDTPCQGATDSATSLGTGLKNIFSHLLGCPGGPSSPDDSAPWGAGIPAQGGRAEPKLSGYFALCRCCPR